MHEKRHALSIDRSAAAAIGPLRKGRAGRDMGRMHVTLSEKLLQGIYRNFHCVRRSTASTLEKREVC
jgi:hypothetical protein